MGLIAVLIVVGAISLPVIRSWRLNRSLHFAERAIDAQDYRSAFLLLDGLARANPGKPEVQRPFARLLEAYSPPEALAVWESLARLQPVQEDDLVGCITAQLRAGRVEEAAATLRQLEELNTGSADYHRLSAAVALARRDDAGLRAAMQAWARANPREPSARFGWATLQLSSSNESEVAAARATLEELARGLHLRIRAVLALLSDAPRRWPDRRGVAAEAEQVALVLADREREGRPMSLTRPSRLPLRNLADLVAYMKAEPNPQPEDVARLAAWLLGLGRGREALLWLESLEGNARRSPEAMEARINCAASIGAWSRVEEWLVAGAWGPVSPRLVRMAFEAEEWFARSEGSRAQGKWNSVLAEATHSVPDLRMLHRLAQLWRWPPERQLQVLWLLVRQSPGDRLAWRLLSERAQATRKVNEMWRVYAAWREAEPSNLQVQTEQLMLGLLVRPQEPDLAAEAASLFQTQPDSPAARAVFALAEWRKGRAKEALAVLDAGSLDYRAEPRFALIRGLILAGLGRHTEAAELFAALPSHALLAEEEALVATARRAAP